jgi:ankyrin repeat protein
MKQFKHYPIEIIHYAGMNDTCLNKIKEILILYPEYVHTINKTGDSSLIIACKSGNIKIVEFLLKTNININLINNDGLNALYYAALKEDFDIIDLLLSNGINIQSEKIFNNNKISNCSSQYNKTSKLFKNLHLNLKKKNKEIVKIVKI